jgi:hypothetical protein
MKRPSPPPAAASACRHMGLSPTPSQSMFKTSGDKPLCTECEGERRRYSEPPSSPSDGVPYRHHHNIDIPP